MPCKGCSSKDGAPSTDKHGNPVIGQNELAKEEELINSTAKEVSYKEYLTKRESFRKRTRDFGNKKVKEFSKDYKRIQIDELISVYNHDEVHFKLTPSQALVALWEFAHHPDYQDVFEEFVGLREQIDDKYRKLKEDHIKLIWKP